MSETPDISDLICISNGNNAINISNSGEENVDEVRSDPEENVLCLIWKNGKLGATYYNFHDKLLYVYEEMLDFGPQFFVTRSLHQETSPKHVVTIGRKNDEYVKMLQDLLTVGDDDVTATSDSVKSLPTNLNLLSNTEYSYEICKEILLSLSVASYMEETDKTRELYLNSLINFDYKMAVHTAGALIKYLDKNWAYFTQSRDDFQVLYIQQISMKSHVLMDSTTFKALHIFQQYSHDAAFKRGLQSSNREGLSVFKLFSSSCKSKIGQSCLRNMLLNPLNDMGELQKRLDFIAFVLAPGSQDFIESLQDNIKNFGDISNIFLKIQNARANSSDWNCLYRSIYHTIFINELSTPFRSRSRLLQELHSSITMELIGLENSISNAIDFSNMNTYGRPVIKMGLDQHLDAKKLKRDDITKHVTAAARIAVQELPDFLHECAIVYLPEMGHLIAIKEWAPNCNPEELQELGFHYMFTLRGTIHYKNPMCLELDQNLGDINAEIIAHENRIVQRLSAFILKYNKDIREPLKILALIDSLIAIAKVSAQNNYVRPNLNSSNYHEIEECRHPLLELVCHFEPNDFNSGQNYSHIKIITGPNGSGKSVYLKQIALVIYFAHIGCYVPAKRANIAMMHSIHSRMQATESASVRLSAFMIDVTQATQALNNAKSNSLVLLDEFGRGTVEDEGLALLVGVLKKFYEKQQFCPHILVSSHFQKMSQYLPQSPLVDHLNMTHSRENGTLLYLYKITQGVSSSFALDIAEDIGFDADIIKRAREFLESNTIKPSVNCSRYRQLPDLNSKESLVDFLKNLEIPEPDD